MLDLKMAKALLGTLASELVERFANFCSWQCVTSIAGPYGDTQLYER